MSITVNIDDKTSIFNFSLWLFSSTAQHHRCLDSLTTRGKSDVCISGVRNNEVKLILRFCKRLMPLKTDNHKIWNSESTHPCFTNSIKVFVWICAEKYVIIWKLKDQSYDKLSDNIT